jgi:hypothetical protein
VAWEQDTRQRIADRERAALDNRHHAKQVGVHHAEP